MTDLFKTKVESMPVERQSNYDAVPFMTERQAFPAGASIAVDMTCEQRRNLNMSNYPRYSALDIEHVRRPRFGKGM